MTMPQRGLYAVTQTENKSPDTVVAEVAEAIEGGAVIVQYRDKYPVDAQSLAEALLKVCHDRGVPLIVNDDIELAAAIHADGVHLGKDDAEIESARVRLGSNAIIGVSCYDSPERAAFAQQAGADYVAFGRFFASGTKPLASPASVETLREAKHRLRVPVVAIGGILPENGQALLDAGADLLAVVGGIFDREPKASARAFQPLFDQVRR
ncbi:MAG: thiamine phosphate synthase [Gammaproteobacteria bacterium]